MLKFNHGVEIGARLAYLGHYERTQDRNVLKIANQELEHLHTLEDILRYYGESRSKLIDAFFKVVGTTIRILCQISPNFLLNFVARSMEVFAVVNYSYLSTVYKDFEYTLKKMAKTELEHQRYFSRK